MRSTYQIQHSRRRRWSRPTVHLSRRRVHALAHGCHVCDCWFRPSLVTPPLLWCSVFYHRKDTQTKCLTFACSGPPRLGSFGRRLPFPPVHSISGYKASPTPAAEAKAVMPSEMTFDTTTPCRQQPHCLGCNYPLSGLESSSCPECGQGFERSDRRTVRAGPRLNGRPARIALGSYCCVSALVSVLHPVGIFIGVFGLFWMIPIFRHIDHSANPCYYE